MSASILDGRAAMRHFHELDRDAQAEVIRTLAADGMAEYSIAAATKLSVEMVRQILAA